MKGIYPFLPLDVDNSSSHFVTACASSQAVSNNQDSITHKSDAIPNRDGVPALALAPTDVMQLTQYES